MEGDGGDNTRVSCLATVRYALAAVVGAAAFSVVVMVITVVRRSEEIHLSIDRGYVAAQGLQYLADVGAGNRRLLSTSNNTTSSQLSNATLRVVFTASNPSGRGDVTCSSITVGLLDIMSQSSSSTPGMETIVRFSVDTFDLPKESTHIQPRRVPIEDADQRRYILGRYNSVMLFRVAVMVNMQASPHNKKHGSSYTFYCWPIIVGSGYSDLDSTSDVPCNKMANQDIPHLRRFPAQAPEPAPAPTS